MSKMLAAARSRPHIGAEQLKYQYFVTVHSVRFLPGCTIPSSQLSVLWTRGSKTAISQEATVQGADRSVTFGQTLTLICTLFRSGGSFSEKLCSFALIRHGARGAQTLAKCKVDVAPFASCPVSAPRRLALSLSKGSSVVATLEVSVSSRLQRELPTGGDNDNSDAASISSCGSSLLDDVAYADEESEQGLPLRDSHGSFGARFSGGADDRNSGGALSGWEGGGAIGARAAAPLASLSSLSPAALELYAESMSGGGSPYEELEPVDAIDADAAQGTDAPPHWGSRLSTDRLSGDASSCLDASRMGPRLVSVDLSGCDDAPGGRAACDSRLDDGGSGTRSSTGSCGGAAAMMQPDSARAETGRRHSDDGGAAAEAAGRLAVEGAAAEKKLRSLQLRHSLVRSRTPPLLPGRGSGVGGAADIGVRGTCAASAGESGAGGEVARCSAADFGWGCMSPRGGLGSGSISSEASHWLTGDDAPSPLFALEASNKQLSAQLAASHTLARKTHARFDEERREWESERAALREELAALRTQMVAADAAARQSAHEARQAGAALAEARSEVARLKREKKDLGTQLEQGADADDRMAIQQDLQGKLTRAEQHREDNARKLAKARKHQQSLLAQSEAEIDLLSQRLEAMEDEIGSEMQMRIDLEKEHMALRAEAEATARENDELRDRAARREAVKPAGLLELQDQLEMADEVRVTLCADIAKLTEELVTVKLQRAVDETDKEALRQRLRASTEKQRQLAVRMTELEVELSERDESGAETEEAIAGAFREVMQLQEKKVRELEAALAEARQGGRASTGMLNGIAGLSRGRPKSLWGLG